MLKLYLVLLYSCICNVLSDDINIGGIFEKNELHKKAFEYIISNLQEDPLKFVAVIDDQAEPKNPYSAIKSACNLLNSKTVAIFGPKSPENIDAVESVCDAKEVPLILTRWNHRPSRAGASVNFYPHPPLLTKAYMEIISAWGWSAFTVFYDDDESLLRVSDFVRMAKEEGRLVTIEQLDKEQTGDYRKVLKNIRKTGQKFFVIDCHIDILKEVLLHFQQVGLMTDEHNYFLTSLDAHTADLTPFMHSGTNITGIRLVNPEDIDDETKKIFQEYFPTDPFAYMNLQVETALIIDAIRMLSRVFNQLESSVTLTNDIHCNTSESWEHGFSIINLLKTSSYKGLTDYVRFSNEGYRSDFRLEILELAEGGTIQIGSWNSSDGLKLSRVPIEEGIGDEYSLRNRTFVVQIQLTDPYAMLKEMKQPLHANDRYEGFGIDLIIELSKMEHFNYTFIEREDKDTGSKLANGQWSGMIGDLQSGMTDLAICDFTITAERVEVIDFTSPFMNLGISILFQKPTKAPPSFFSFAQPFALDTWIALGVSFVVVSLSFFVLGRICADEWTNPYPCIEEPEYLINQFSMANSIWCVTGSIMCQGSEIAPIAISTRAVAAVWWFFVLLIAASYTANLASFLVTTAPVHLFTDVDSLVKNAELHGIRYGAKDGGTTQSFFENKKENAVYQKIAKHMRNNPKDMMKSAEGVTLAANENERYAYFMESSSIEYTTQRYCNLRMVGGLLDEKGYGIAMKKNSPYRTKLSTAILKLQSAGILQEIKRKWWEERKGGGQCTDEATESEATPLDLLNVEGVFYVTIYGSILSVILVIVEYIVNVLNMSRRAKLPFKEVFMNEVKCFITFSSNVKPFIGSSSSETKSKSESEKVVEENPSKSQKSKSDSKKSTSNSNLEGSQDRNSKPPPCGFIVSPSVEGLTETP